MKPPTRGREAQIALHLACLRRIREASEAGVLDMARAFMLVNMVATYLPLSEQEQDELRVQLQQGGDTTLEATELTWADRILLRGREQGRQEGMEQGRQEGMEQGRQEGLRLARQALRGVLTKQFGSVPSSISAQLDQIEDPQRLERLLNSAFLAASLEEFRQTLD